ncbi:MAG TPA: DUF488 domain-containing protein [Thermoplasmata archaeon]|nr:DUF488 domain-containing protein [Thermoplasmata archaeon]
MRGDPMRDGPGLRVWTIGHSTRPWDAFLALLREHRIRALADVRHVPASGRAPWARRDALETALPAMDILYAHFADLGGFRRPRPDSTNTAWRSEAFRGYADHMTTDRFAAALDRLVALATDRRAAIMCAEAVPWRCHRSLLSDALIARGVRVVHILGPGSARDHALAPFARVRGGLVTYPGTKAALAKPDKRRTR